LEASLRDDADLSEDLRASTLAAVAALRALLGEEWLGRETGQHPVLGLFWNHAEWTRVRLCTLAEALTTVNRLPGGTQLVARVCQGPEAAAAALLEIETAWRSLTHGCAVELEPPTGGAKHCDLALTSAGGRRVFVEITGVAQMSSAGDEQEQLLNRKIYPLLDLIGSDHTGGGRLFFWPEDDERDELVAAAQSFWAENLPRAEHAELDIPGTLHLWCEPWSEGGPTYSFQGPLHNNVLGRIRRAVRNKLAQLPRHDPGVILVRPPTLLWQIPDAVPTVARTIAAAVGHSPQVVAVVLVTWGHSFDRSARRVRVSDTAELIISPDRHIFVRQSLVVWNAARGSRDVDEMVEVLA
jgi:hypothetical protein